MEINRTGITYFSPDYRLIQVLCERHRTVKTDDGETDVVSNPTFYVNCDSDAQTYAAKAISQGDKVLGFFERSNGKKEATRQLYLGTDGNIVEGASQDEPGS